MIFSFKWAQVCKNRSITFLDILQKLNNSIKTLLVKKLFALQKKIFWKKFLKMGHITFFPGACWYWPQGKKVLRSFSQYFVQNNFFYEVPNFFTICTIKNKISIVLDGWAILEWSIQNFVVQINKNTIVCVLCYKYS